MLISASLFVLSLSVLSDPVLLLSVLTDSLVMGNKSGKPVLRSEDVLALSRSSGLTEEQVRQTFSSFLEDHPNGKLNTKDFRQMMQKALPERDAKKMGRHVFRFESNIGIIHF